MVGLTSASVKRLSASPTENLPGYSWKPGNCANSDTVAITGFKPVNDCKSGIHFPNSFTPDNNGHNDTYRPVVQGQLDKFRLLIYNRYGEKVFETTNYRQGWNGVYNGQLQNVNQFVWVCYYQFSGEKEQMEKGVVFLLR
jgi:gliding motility-associated-like protein